MCIRDRDKIYIYKEKIGFNNVNEYQLKSIKNWDIVAIMDTNKWLIKIKLFTKDVPRMTLNFIGLAQNWNYNWVIFHRVIKNFMIQWWDPTWTGMWWNSIYWWKFKDKFSEKLSNISWSVSMANSWKDTNWSQFFINEVSNTFLDYNKSPDTSKHSVFGQVIVWMEVVNKIADIETDKNNNKPTDNIIINTVTIKEYSNWKYKDYKIDIEKEIKKLEANEKIEEEIKNLEKKNRKAIIWDKVKVHYILSLTDWELIDSSYDTNTEFEFIIWSDDIIKGFSSAVKWMKIDEIKNITISSDEWYWKYNEDNTQTVDKSSLKSFVDAGIVLEAWNVLPTPQGDFKILSTTDTEVIIDTNHPLAWKELVFKIELIDFVD